MSFTEKNIKYYINARHWINALYDIYSVKVDSMAYYINARYYMIKGHGRYFFKMDQLVKKLQFIA